MGEPYDAEHQFTVEELLAYNLGSHTQTINAIYSAAVAEFSIEQKLVKIRKLWTDKEFKLAKHIPDSVFKRGKWHPNLLTKIDFCKGNFAFYMIVLFLIKCLSQASTSVGLDAKNWSVILDKYVFVRLNVLCSQ